MEQEEETKLEQTLEGLIEEKKYAEIKTLLSSQNEVDIAALLSDVPEAVLPKVFRLLSKDMASDVFIELDSEAQENLIASFTDAELSAIVNDLFVDDTVDIIEEMPANVVKRILSSVSPEMRTNINQILNYPADSAGAIMTTEYITLRAGMTVEEAFEKIRRQAIDKETIYTLYVTDESRRLIGVVSARALMLSDRKQRIGEIMEENVIFSTTSADKEEVARQIDKYSFLSLPIVDKERRIVGIVTVDDAMDILRQENTEDISKMAAIRPTVTPYLKTSVIKVFLSRLPWLLILMISATFTGWIIDANETMLRNPIFPSILVGCIPMLMDTGGNAGSQASVTIIRGLALGEIKFKDIFRIMFKEFRVSLLLGLAVSIVCFGKLMAIDMLFKETNGILIAFIISFSIFITIVIAKFVGCVLPLLAKKIRLDPAVVASPFITTIVDALALMIYCAIAIGLLGV